MNPPYSQCQEWMRKAYGAAQEGAAVVCLVPHRHGLVAPLRHEGRDSAVAWPPEVRDATNSAPFPSAVVVFRPRAFALTAWEPEAA